MDLKNLLKSLKLNESSISMALGGIIILVVGFLVINYFNKPKAEINDQGTSTEIMEQTESKPKEGNQYTVSEGDTLWNIAENAYGDGFKWVDIAKDNNIENASTIEKGQKLNIPQLSDTKMENEKMAMDDSYTVVKGDSLWEIAVKEYGDGFKWVDIAKANNLDNPNIIHTGNVLELPR